MPNQERFQVSHSGPPNEGQGRIRPPSTTNNRYATTSDDAPNRGMPPSADHAPQDSSSSNTTSVSTPTPASIQYIPLWETVPLVPLPHPLQILPPWQTGFLAAPPSPPSPEGHQILPPWQTGFLAAPPSPEGHQTLTIPDQSQSSNGEYFLMPGNRMARYLDQPSPSPSPSHHHSRAPSPVFTPPHALPLATGGSYLPAPGAHITLVVFPLSALPPWMTAPHALKTPALYTVPTSIGINDLIRQLGGQHRGVPEGTRVGLYTCTLWRGGREVEAKEREWRGEWKQGERYLLSGEGAGEKVCELQGFLAGQEGTRRSVGVVCCNG